MFLPHSDGMKLVINRDNRVTVPAALRGELGLRAGDEVEFTIYDGGLLIRPTKANAAQNKPSATDSHR